MDAAGRALSDAFFQYTINAAALGAVNAQSAATLSGGTTVIGVSAGTTNDPGGTAAIVEDFDLFEALDYGYSYYKTLAPSGDTAGVTVYYNSFKTFPDTSWNIAQSLAVSGSRNSIIPYYSSATHSIYMYNMAEPVSYLYWQVILHEYGHYIADINGFLSAGSERHGFGYNLRGSADLEHSLLHTITTNDRETAWNEGYADFFSTRAMVVEAGVLSNGAGNLGIDNLAETLVGTGTTHFGWGDLNLALPLQVSDERAGRALGEDTEASVAAILYQLATVKTDKDKDLFDYIRGAHRAPGIDAVPIQTLGEFFNKLGPIAAPWVESTDTLARYFAVNGVTPTALTTLTINDTRTFTFQIPPTIRKDGSVGVDAFSSFQLLFYDDQGNAISTPVSARWYGAKSPGYSVEPRTMDWHGLNNVPISYGTISISASEWNSIVTGPNGQLRTNIKWTVRGSAAKVIPYTYYQITSDPGFFPPTETIQNPTLLPILPLNCDLLPLDTLAASAATSFVLSGNRDHRHDRGKSSTPRAMLVNSIAGLTPTWTATPDDDGNWTYEVTDTSGLDLATMAFQDFIAVAVEGTGDNSVYSAPSAFTLTPNLLTDNTGRPDPTTWTRPQQYEQYVFDPETLSVWYDTTTLTGPTAGSVTATQSSTQSSPLQDVWQLTASDFNALYDTPNSQVQSVSFYAQQVLVVANGEGLDIEGPPVLLGDGASDDSGNWDLSTDLSQLTGEQEIYAMATDGNGITRYADFDGSPIINFNRPVLNSVSPITPTVFDSSTPISLSVGFNSPGQNAAITSVSYYVDTSGIGPFSPGDGDVKRLGTANSPGTGAYWPINVNFTGYSGLQTVYAVAQNSDGWQSASVAGEVFIDQPVVGSLTASTDDSSGTPDLMLTANDVGDGIGDAPSVEFYLVPSGATTFSQSQDLDLGAADGSTNWSIDVSPQFLSGPATFFAVASDNGHQSVPVSATIAPVVIGQTSASYNNLYFNGQPTTLTASSLLDWNSGATITGVNFYPAASDGSFTTSTTPVAGISDGNGNWNASVTPSGWTGEQTYYAVATDSTGIQSDPVAIIIDPHQPPTVDSVTAATDTTTGTHYISLTANGVDDGSQVASVAFYQVGVAQPLQTLTQAEYAAGWTINGVDISSDGSNPQFYAVVTNDAGQTTQSPTLSISGMTIGQFGANPGQYVPGMSLTLNATGILDWSGGTGATVQFYQDTSGTGDFTQATALGAPLVVSAGSASYSFSATDTNAWTGPQIFYAVASDGAASSAPMEFVINQDQAPTLDSLTAVSDTSGGTPMLDLTANGAFDLDGTVDQVEFYVTAPGSSTPTDLGSATAANNWTLPVNGATYLSSGPAMFTAVAVDDDFAPSAPVSLALDPVTVDYLMATVGEYVPGQALNLSVGGVSDWAGGTISRVDYYQLLNPAGPMTPANGSLVGTSSDGSSGWAISDSNTYGLSGDETFFAIATDNEGNSSSSRPAVLLGVAQDQLPTIDSLSASIDPSSGSPRLTLTANNVQADGWVQTVNFYTYGLYGGYNWIGSDDGTNGWSLSGIDVTSLTGPQEYVAIATDNLGVQSAPAIATYSPQELYWDPAGNVGTSVDISSGAGLGGSGTWTVADSSVLDWYNAHTGALQAWNNGGDNVAVFEGSSGTVNVTSTLETNTLRFSSDGYTLSYGGGNGIAIDGIGAVDVASGSSATIDVSLTGSHGLTKTSSGATLFLDAWSSYSGATAIDDGAIVLGNSGALGSSSVISSSSSATLDLNGNWIDSPLDDFAGTLANSSWSSATIAGNVNASHQDSFQVDGEAGDITLSGTTNFAYSTLTKSGGDTLTLGNVTGDGYPRLVVEGGTVNVNGSGGALSAALDGSSLIANDESVNLDHGASGSVAVAGGGTLNVNGTSGTLDDALSDASIDVYDGTVDVSLTSSGDSLVAVGGAVTVDGTGGRLDAVLYGGTLEIDGSAVSLDCFADSSVAVNSGGALAVNSHSDDGLDVSLDSSSLAVNYGLGQVSGTASSVSNAGVLDVVGNLEVAAGVSNSGDIQIESGVTLQIDAGGISDGTVENFGYLAFGSEYIGSSTQTLSADLTNSGTLAVLSTILDVTAPIDNEGGNIYTNLAVLSLSGIDNASGHIDVSGGTLYAADVNNQLGSITTYDSASAYISDIDNRGGGIDVGNGSISGVDNCGGVISVYGYLSLASVDNSNGTIAVSGSSSGLDYSGSIDNSHGVISSDNGAWLSLSFTGDINNEGGTISVSGDVYISGNVDNEGGDIELGWGSLGVFGTVHNEGGSIQVSGSGNVLYLSASSNFFNAGGSVYGDGGATLNVSLSGIVDNSGGSISGNGTINISGNVNNAAGHIELDSGNLAVGGAVNNAGGVIDVQYGGTLDLSGTIDNTAGSIFTAYNSYGSTLELENGTTITGGYVSANSG